MGGSPESPLHRLDPAVRGGEEAFPPDKPREPTPGSLPVVSVCFVSGKTFLLDKCRKTITGDQSVDALGTENTVPGSGPTGRFQ